MKKLAIILTLIIAFTSSCSDDDPIRGSGNLVEESREVGIFDKVKSNGVFQVDIVQGEEQMLIITADDNILDDVITKVENGELLLDLKGENYSNITLKAEIVITDFTGIDNSGVGDVTIREIDTDSPLEVINSGTGDIDLYGEAPEMRVFNEGTGKIKGFALEVEKARVETSGTGDVEVYVTEDLDVTISGSSNVYYKGSPTLNVTIEGSGQVVQVN